MRPLRENLLVQFSVVSFATLAILAVVTSTMIGTGLNGVVRLLEDHDAAMSAGIEIIATDPFSIPNLNRDIFNLHWVTYGIVGGSFLVLYGTLVFIVRRVWKTIVKQRKLLESANIELERKIDVRTVELRSANERLVLEVSERKRTAEEAGRLARAAATIGEGICVTDLDGCIEFVNPALQRMLGYEPSELLGMSVSTLYPGGTDNPVFQEILQAVTVDGWAGEVELQSKSGERIPTYETATPIHDETGQLVGYVCVNADMSERKQAEDALVESEKRYRSIYDNTPVMMQTADRDARLINVNNHWLEVLGYERSEVLGRQCFDFLTETTRRDALDVSIPELFITGFLRDVDRQVVKRNGEVIDVLFSAAVQRDEAGEITHSLGFLVDVTKRRRAEEALMERMREVAVLGERNRMAREIHDTLAQEFTGISLQLEMAELALQEDPSAVQNHLDRAKNLAVHGLNEAMRSVWDLVPQALEERPLEAALEEEVREFRAAGREQTSFTVSGKRRELPSAVQAALLRICQEALTNVRRHARATRVRVVLSFHPDAVHLRVKDNGTGFDVEAMKARERGRSFGLIAMEQRVRLLGGTFAVKSRKGEGALVEVRIPMPAESPGGGVVP